MTTRRKLLINMAGLGLGALPLVLRAQPWPLGRPLQLGVIPTSSTRILLRNYAPVQDYLQRVLGQAVELVTAANFRTFHFNTVQGAYDVVVTAMHFARLAQVEAGWLPLARYAALHQTLLLTARDRPLRQLKDLRGSVISGPDVLTVVSMEAQDWLEARGLRAGVDYTYFEMPTTPAAAHALVNGQSALFFGTPQGMKITPVELTAQIVAFVALPERPNLAWLAHPRLAAQRDLLQTSLMGLNEPSAGAAAFFEATGFQGMRAVSAAEMAGADKYLPRLREAIKSAR